MIRGGRMNFVVMGALQVNDKGDYAGWANPSRGLDVGNIGGSMDLVPERISFFWRWNMWPLTAIPRLLKN